MAVILHRSMYLFMLVCRTHMDYKNYLESKADIMLGKPVKKVQG